MSDLVFLHCNEPAWVEVEPLESWKERLQTYVASTFQATGWSHPSGVDLTLTNDGEIQQINAQYRQKDQPTNVLSFPLLEFDAPVLSTSPSFEYSLLGDVVLSFETVQREAKKMGLPLQHHVAHLVIHGVLHLLGYDHETDEEASLMQAKEIEILSQFDMEDPYPRMRAQTEF